MATPDGLTGRQGTTERLPAAGEPFRVALLSFSDGRLRVHETLEKPILDHLAVLREAIARDPLLNVVQASEIAHSVGSARRIAREARGTAAEAAVFNVPVFAFPNYSLIAARLLDLPVVLCSPKEGKLPGLGGVMAARGGMLQIGLHASTLWGNPLQEPALMQALSAHCRASGARERLKGSVYGVIGGRSIGMNTGAVSTQEWMRDFGIDVEHIDQLELVRRASTVDGGEVDRAYAWLTVGLARTAAVGKAAPEHVKQQIRHYIALKGIVLDYGLDFVGLKCHYDLSEYFVTGCVSAMLMNDPYDWDGPKQAVVTSCEADGDGALTMQVLKLISGFPSLLFDIRHYDFQDRVFICCNCGAMPSWYAARSSRPEENLAKVSLEPVIPKYGGNGAHFPYVCKEGPVTVARLTRVRGRYTMFLARGEFVEYPPEKMRETCAAWPHGYLRMNVEPEELVTVYNSNHAHVVPGDHVQALRYYCELMDIPAHVAG